MCVAICYPGSFKNNLNICNVCDNSCKTCSDAGTTNCLNCNSSLYKNFNNPKGSRSKEETGSCVSKYNNCLANY